MSRLIPCKRRDFIKKLRKLGFEKPKSGTRHQFMVYQQYRLLTFPVKCLWQAASLDRGRVTLTSLATELGYQ